MSVLPLPIGTPRITRCRNPSCRKVLTDPESIRLGYGPECAELFGLIAPAVRVHRWRQDGPDLFNHNQGETMRKIPTLFVRDPDDRRYVTREVTPGCEWVLAGHGQPTRKYDGTCVMFDGERWWARREVKPGKTAPANYLPIETDSATGKTVGWEPIEQSSFAKYHAEAVVNAGAPGVPWAAATYELIGPAVNGNPEGCGKHLLIRHSPKHHSDGASAVAAVLDDAPRDFGGLARWLSTSRFEGIVWHHADGRHAKIKAKDFPPEVES